MKTKRNFALRRKTNLLLSCLCLWRFEKIAQQFTPSKKITLQNHLYKFVERNVRLKLRGLDFRASQSPVVMTVSKRFVDPENFASIVKLFKRYHHRLVSLNKSFRFVVVSLRLVYNLCSLQNSNLPSEIYRAADG